MYIPQIEIKEAENKNIDILVGLLSIQHNKIRMRVVMNEKINEIQEINRFFDETVNGNIDPSIFLKGVKIKQKVQ